MDGSAAAQIVHQRVTSAWRRFKHVTRTCTMRKPVRRFMFDIHAIAVGSNSPSPFSVPFEPTRNVSPHSTIVVLRFGGGAPAAPMAAAGCFRFVAAVAAAGTAAAVADEADEADAAAGDEADAAGRCCNAAGDEADAAVRCCRTAAICERRPASGSCKACVASEASRGM